MPPVGQMIHVTAHYDPPQMIGLKVDLKDPFSFSFIMDEGQTPMPMDVKKTEFNKLVKYFLASLTTNSKDMWVNLSPYESKRIIPEVFAQTEMGRDLLAQDYVLKQFTASLIYPESGLGKKFWDTIYQEAQSRFGTTSIPIDTFNKVWIVADKADIYQKGQVAFLVDCHLKVMLEQDFMASEKNKEQFGNAQALEILNKDAKRKMASDLVRQIIVPAIEKEVNEGKSFAGVRQIYSAEILATWFKKALRQSLLGQVYVDKGKTKGVRVSDPKAEEKIYKQYLRAYKKGVFNFIKEDPTPDGQTIPRKYFSGGAIMTAPEDVHYAMGNTSAVRSLMNRLFGAAKRSTVFIANVFMFASIAGALVGCATPTTKILPPSASLPSKEIVVVHDQSQQITINENTSLYNGHTFSLNEYDGRWYSPGVPDSYTRIYQDSSGKWVFEGRLAIPDQQLAKKLQELQDQVQAARARNNFNTVYNNFFQQLGEIRVAVSDVFSRGEMLDKMEDIKAKLNELQDQVTNLQSTVEQQAAAAADVAEANEQAAKARDEKARVEADARAGKAEAAAVDRAKKAEAAANARESRAEASRAALEAENRISFKTISELILGLSVLVGFGILANSFRQNRLRRQVSGLTARVVFLQNAQNQSLAAQARLQASLQRARTRVTRVVGGIVRRQDAAGERELIDLNAKLAVKNAELERMFRIAVRDMSVAEEDQSVSRIDALARAIAAAHYDVPYNDEMFNNPTDAVRTNLRRLRQHISDEARAGASLSGRDFLLRQLEENTSVGIEIDSLRRQLNSPHFAQGVTRARALAKARARDAVGGINLSDEHLTINIKVDGAGLPMAAKFQDKAMVNLDGITPKIRAITLLTPAEIPELFQLQK